MPIFIEWQVFIAEICGMLKHNFWIIIFWLLISVGCKQQAALPYLGEHEEVDGVLQYKKIGPFAFLDQDSMVVSNETFKDKIYIADFIFLSCPTICPVMTAEMEKVYQQFKDNKSVGFLSHTIDPDRDSIPALKKYANALGIEKGDQWYFVTGNQDSIFTMAEKHYYSTALQDEASPGGFTHSGGLLLIDKNKHIRGVYNGTVGDETKRLIKDISILLKE